MSSDTWWSGSMWFLVDSTLFKPPSGKLPMLGSIDDGQYSAKGSRSKASRPFQFFCVSFDVIVDIFRAHSIMLYAFGKGIFA
jgi:hypothetical protein